MHLKCKIAVIFKVGCSTLNITAILYFKYIQALLLNAVTIQAIICIWGYFSPWPICNMFPSMLVIIMLTGERSVACRTWTVLCIRWIEITGLYCFMCDLPIKINLDIQVAKEPDTILLIIRRFLWNMINYSEAKVNLTHWGQLAHCAIICSADGLAPNRHQNITWPNADIATIGPIETYIRDTRNKTNKITFSWNKMHVKMSSAEFR